MDKVCYLSQTLSHAFDDIGPDDYIMISDVDEIPDPATLKIIKSENILMAELNTLLSWLIKHSEKTW